MIKFKICVLLVSVWSCAVAAQDLKISDADKSILEDAFLTMPQLVTKYGYPVETHNVQTADGYLLTMYRIPYGRNCRLNETKAPILLQHGLLSSSFDFIILGPEKSLGYILADNCYDVWMGNNRGNSLSKKHISLKPKDKNFWKFSWHELGEYDLPAMIDYILNATNQPNLHYIGHSQGTTQFFVFAALHPEYHSKIRTMQALSPVVFMKNLASPLCRFFTMIQKSVEVAANLIGLHEFHPGGPLLNFLGHEICKDRYPNLQLVCSNFLFLLCGFDEPQLNKVMQSYCGGKMLPPLFPATLRIKNFLSEHSYLKTMLPAIIGHTPAGAASKQLLHYAQGIKTGKFRQYDFGIVKNLQIYKSISPPEYDLTKIKIPIALYYGSNDWFASLKDVKLLEGILPNIIEKYLVPYKYFNHLDFIFAIDGMKLIYYRLLEVLDSH